MTIGAIEAGGTKIITAIGNEKGEIYEKFEFPTGSPERAINKIVEYFKDKSIDALGIGTFGPVDINEKSDTYGNILDTPKPGWSNYPFLKEIKKHIKVPKIIDTDVNGAALGEYMWGGAKTLDSCLYLTIGTGVGGGFCSEGKLLHGLLHPEMGHILVLPHENDDYKGHCPFHGNCLEGMAAGPAIEERVGVKANKLAPSHDVWEYEAYYLAQALVTYTYVLSPEVIFLGGGVMKQTHLFPKVRTEFKRLMGNYINKPILLENIEQYIVYPELGENSGTYGALALGTLALNKSQEE